MVFMSAFCPPSARIFFKGRACSMEIGLVTTTSKFRLRVPWLEVTVAVAVNSPPFGVSWAAAETARRTRAKARRVVRMAERLTNPEPAPARLREGERLDQKRRHLPAIDRAGGAIQRR